MLDIAGGEDISHQAPSLRRFTCFVSLPGFTCQPPIGDFPTSALDSDLLIRSFWLSVVADA
jgi:hypothetical protein